MKKTFYEADCSALNCLLQIRINDVEVFTAPIDGQMRTDIPINMGILESGVQEIEVRGLPLSNSIALNENAYIRYQINDFDLSTGSYKFIKQFKNHQTAPVQKGSPLIVHKSTFLAEVPYKLEAWQKGLDLKDVENIKAKLKIAYNKLITHLKKGEFDNLLNALKKREKNAATAMYLSDSESQNRISKLIFDFKSGFKVMPLTSNIRLEYSAYGKLASLISEDNMSALRLENEDTEEELILPVTFYIPEGKTEFEVI